MANITASMVKELRDRTGAGMMEAKKALVAADGSVDDAIKALRESGAIKAEKKSARATNEGTIGAYVGDSAAALVEMLCETDFVAKNDQFKSFATKVAESVVKAGTADDLENVAFVDGGTIGEALKQQVLTIGENLQVGKAELLKGDNTFYGLYVHNNGKIGVLTQITGAADEAGENVAKDVAMHAAFTNPIALNRDGVSEETVAKEREVFEAQARNEGKPENILPKIVEGKVNAFYKDQCLAEQMFVKDNKKNITQVVGEAGDFTLSAFSYISIG